MSWSVLHLDHFQNGSLIIAWAGIGDIAFRSDLSLHWKNEVHFIELKFLKYREGRLASTYISYSTLKKGSKY